jgi:membrane protease YdiL (CAAX protease family)
MTVADDWASDARAARGHWVPFAVWIGGLLLVQAVAGLGVLPRGAPPLVYTGKALLCAGLLAAYKPWRGYEGLRPRDWFPALAAGLGVASLWILPETPLVARLAPAWQEAYHRWLILPLGRLPDYYDPALFPSLPFNHPSLAYRPAECGWMLAIGRLLGSAFVIAVIEEFFFRGLLYRWLRGRPFHRIPLGRYDAGAFWTIVVLFGLEHDRWAAGMVAGMAYGWLVLWRGSVAPAIVAHVTTNLALGLYVMVSGQYGFW